MESTALSPKSGLTTFLLCLVLGLLGIHRFYVGKVGTGVLMLLTGGGLGIWYLYDLISIVCNKFTDKEDRVVEIAKNPSTVKKALIIIGALFAGIMVLVITFMVAINMMMGPMTNVAKNELAAIRAGDFEKAYSYTSAEFKDAVPMDDFKKFVDHYPQLTEYVSVSFTSKEIKDSMGTVKGTLTLKDGTTIPATVKLIKQDGEWRILGIGLNQTDQE